MRKILFRLFALLIGIGFALIFLELSLRLNPKFGYNYNAFRFKSNKVSGVPDFTCLQPSALLGYENIPGFGSYGGVGKINSYGLIGKEYKFHKDKGTFRILVLGDSIAAQGWTSEFLEDYLNESSFGTKYKNFEVWTNGVTSYDVRRYALYLKYRGLSYKPDMVIIFFCLNDFDLNLNIYYYTKDGAAEYYFPISAISKRYKVNPFFMKHSYLYRFIILRIDSYLVNKKKTKGINQLEENGKFYLGIIKDICRKNGIPLIAVIFPYLIPLTEYNVGQNYEYQTLSRVINELKIDCLDLHPYLSGKDIYSLRLNSEDYIHPSLEGHRFIAKVIYDFLLKHFLVETM